MPRLTCPVEGCAWQSQDLDAAFASALTTALQMHDKSAHPSASSSGTKLKLTPPQVGNCCDPDQWSAFTRQWEMYKVGMAITGTMIPTALFYCCSQDLRTDIMRDTSADVSTMTEKDLLAAIRRLAVKEESTLVHRMKLNKMTQPPGTNIRTFLANLRGQASLCQYSVKCKEPGCTHTFDFRDEIIKDNLVRGIADPEILSDLLGDPKTDRTLEETVAFIAQKEQGKATRSAVGDSSGAISHSINPTPQSQPRGRCWACGEPSHGPKNDRNTRAKFCRAWSFSCAKCSVKGHYTSCCSKCTSCDNWGHRDKSSKFCQQSPGHRVASSKKDTKHSKTFQTEDDAANYVFDQLCGTSSENKPLVTLTPPKKKPLEHHVFDGQWIARPSKPHPIIRVQLTPTPEDHAAFGFPIPDTSRLSTITVPMIADSGCQSSIIPLHSARAMGYSQADIIPVKLVMRGAIKEDLGVAGAIITSVTTTDTSGTPRSTRQLMYVSAKMEKAFLCREALVDLGVLPANFPQVPAQRPQESLASLEAPQYPACSCPKRGQEPPPIPSKLPAGLTATKENVPALKEWLVNYYSATAFNTCEHQPLPMMNCEPLHLYVDPEAKPVAVHKPALVPIHWQEKVHQDLERDVRLGVLEKVDPNTPVTWCSRMVITPKADGTPRRTVDLQPQNRHAVRQTHHVSTPFHLADRIPQNTKKTVTDAWNGYHSVPIHRNDRHVTTFITPWGRYRYKVAPQGFLASGDGYTQRFDAIIADFPNKVKCVDDTCMWADSIEEAFYQTCHWLDLCARNGITLNPKKFQFAEDTVEFAGMTVTPTNIKPSMKFLDSIRHFPTPADISGARAWFGLVNQGAYAFSMAKQMKAFRHLLKPSTKFDWTDELDALFHQSKVVVIEEMKEGVRLFEPSRTTCLSTDWSVDGIGFLMKQKYCKCLSKTPTCCQNGWKLCLVGSRFTTPTESRYAPIEGEALAVAYALHQTRYYTLGCTDLIVATDHKPLTRILNDKSLTEIDNRRLLNLKEKTLAHRFTIIHVSGSKNKGPDAASRYPAKLIESTQPPDELPDPLAEDAATAMAASDTLYAISNVVTWNMVREATASDPTLTLLMEHLLDGFSKQAHDLPPELRPFQRYASSLCCVDGVILMGHRIVIPEALKPSILNALHAAHQGVGAMCARAGDSIFWPNITTDITRTREECTHCHRSAKSNPMQPPCDISPPDYPFQKICADYFSFNNNEYVVIVDRYSSWPIVHRSESGADGLVKRLRETFVTFGVPEELTSDGGPQFTAGKTQDLLKSWGVHHRLTSVANPHANCRAEIAVKSVKRMLMDNTGPTGSLDIDKFQRAMLIYRNTIDPETKASPALILFGRPIRDSIPIPMGRYCPHNTWQETLAHREKALAKRHSRAHEKWSEHTRLLQPLKVGDHVYVQNLVGNNPNKWERTGVVVEIRQFHQYVVRIDGSGRVTLRNRQHLRKFTPFQQSSEKVIMETRPPPSSVPAANGDNRSILDQSALPAAHQSPGQGNAAPNSTRPPAENPPQAPASPDLPAVPAEPQPPGDEGNMPNDTPVNPTVPPSQNLPRALARLLPHNAPGLSEQQPPKRRHCKHTNNPP